MKNDLINNNNQKITDEDLYFLAEKLCIEDASLTGSHPPHILHGVKELMRNVNSYCSIDIDLESSHPTLMDRYSKEGFSGNTKEARLQLNSLRHIEQQRTIEEHFNDPELDIFRQKLIEDTYNKLFNSSAEECTDKGIIFECPKHKTKAEKIIFALKLHYFISDVYYKSSEYRIVARLILDGILTNIIEGYGLWNISRGLHAHSTEYEKFLNMNDECQEEGVCGLGSLSPENSKKYIKFMLEVALEQVYYTKENLNINTMYKNMQHYGHLSKAGLFEKDTLPEDSELLFKELLLLGEIPRGDVAQVIDKSARTATYLNKKLTNMNLIMSDTPKGPIRLRFNMHLASYLFPGLIK